MILARPRGVGVVAPTQQMTYPSPQLPGDVVESRADAIVD
jgi:hypothetical protein